MAGQGEADLNLTATLDQQPPPIQTM